MSMSSRYVEEGSAFVEIAGADLKTRVSQPKTRQGLVQSPIQAEATERFHVVVIGGGQSGLSVGYYLARRGIPFVILDANERVGDPWRKRWDSLRLFTHAKYDGLDGFPFAAPRNSFPTKNEMADYLEAYAARFNLPVRTGVKVDGVSRQGGRFVIAAGDRRFEADQVVVAMSRYQDRVVPSFAAELDPGIVQVHSFDYRRPSQLADGDVLIVGAGNSGADIAMELAKSRKVWLSGRHPGHIPFRIEGFAGRNFLAPLVIRFVFHRILTANSLPGRKIRPKVLSQGGPLIRVKPKDLAAAGVERAPRTAGVRDGLPLLADGRVLDVANVIWCTGFDTGFSWIDLPVFDADGQPRQERGAAIDQAGLYFIGLPFIHSFSSAMIHGVGRDSEHIAGLIASRVGALA